MPTSKGMLREECPVVERPQWPADGQPHPRYGDVPQWAALLADRRLMLRHLPHSPGTRRWLEEVFARLGNAENLRFTE